MGIEGGEASKWKSLDGTVQELKLQEVNHRFRVGELAVLDAPGWIGPSKVGWMCIHGPLRVHVDSAVLSSFSSTFTLRIKHINMYSRVSDRHAMDGYLLVTARAASRALVNNPGKSRLSG